MRVADAIFERLAKETDCVFFVPGGSAMFLVDALGRSGIKAVSAIHEQGAGAMALGYAASTGKLGVCLTISGPGAANAITPCLAAWTDSIPVLFISGQARTETLGGDGLRTHGLQPGPIIQMVKPITKDCFEFNNPFSGYANNVMGILDHMILLSLNGRKGPCWLSVPQDIQAQVIE